MNKHTLRLTGLMGAALLSGACSGSGSGDSATDFGEAREALVAADTYLYLLCNSTGWQPTAEARLTTTPAPGFFELQFEVTQPWIVSGSDTCVLAETNELNGWGSSQTRYGIRGGSLEVPGAAQLLTGAQPFQVNYDALGTYKAIANMRQGVFVIEEAAASGDWLPTVSAEVSSIAQSPVLPAVYWVGFDNGDVYRTGNGKSASPSWQRVDEWVNSGGPDGLPDGVVRDIAVSRQFEDTAVLAFAGEKQGSKLWSSAPGGEFWLNVSDFPQASVGEILSVALSPIDGRVYVTGLGGSVAGFISGSSWSPANSPDPLLPAGATGQVTTAAVVSETPDHIWVGTSTGELFATFNGGSTFTNVIGMGYPQDGSAVVDIAPGSPLLSPPEVFVTRKGMQAADRVYKTSNGGQGWVNIHANLETNAAPPSLFSVGSISVNPADTEVLYLSYTFEQASSENAGQSWAD